MILNLMHNQKFNEYILIFLFADSNNSDSVKVGKHQIWFLFLDTSLSLEELY